MKALVFAHYDSHGVVDDYVLHALRCFRPYFDLICFCSTAEPSLEQQTRAGIYADIVIWRPNIGYDFLSWREGFEALPNIDYEEVVFANDSCYGPCSDITEFFGRVYALKADLWGAAVNHQFRPHVQSFFMGFGAKLLKSGFARRFWQSVEIEPEKYQLILRFEVGLSADVENEGFRIGGVVDLAKIDQHTRERAILDNAPYADAGASLSETHPKKDLPVSLICNDPCPNPSQLFWAELLRRGSPFVKIELLRDNPLGANLDNVREQLRADNWYDVGLIDRHLERIAPRAQWFKTRRRPADRGSVLQM